ncbi:hypothetical protein NHX12_017098, partial [Muraenolepis orangiensis]
MDPSGRPIPAKRTVFPPPPAAPQDPTDPTDPTDQPIYLNVFPECQEERVYDNVVTPGPVVPPRQAPPPPAPTDSHHTHANANAALSLDPGRAAAGSSEDAAGGQPNPRPPVPPPLPPRRKPTQGHFLKRFSCPIKLNRSATITEDPDTGSINLIDAPQGSTKSLAAFCESMSMLAVKFPHYEQEYNPGLVKAHLSRRPLALLGVDQLTFTVASDWDNCPIPFPTPLNKTVSNLIDAVAVVLDIPEDTRQYYLLKLCDSQEFLHRDEALGDHECIRRYHKFNQDVPLQLLHISNVNDSLARDEEDDKAP